QTLHERAKLDPINVRLAKLSRKTLYKMKDLYIHSDGAPTDLVSDNLAFDYSINIPPMRNRERSLPMQINDEIYNHVFERSPPIFNLPLDIKDFPIPNPIYI
ncbi:MAG: hypothetical protein AAGM46_28170, partial [Cyanobacteria bacterium J06582_2]